MKAQVVVVIELEPNTRFDPASFGDRCRMADDLAIGNVWVKDLAVYASLEHLTLDIQDGEVTL